MTEVFLHVYDVTNSANAKTNTAIVQLNKVMRDGIGVGGIFHSAVEVHDHEEWSFGYCPLGSGVFNCPPKSNPMYTYRETISLGKTQLTRLDVHQILVEFGKEWQGTSYDLLSRNCNHFCDAFCERLGVQKFPAWINRFAHAGDAAMEVAESTMKRLRQAKADIVSASKSVFKFMIGGGGSSCSSAVSPEPGSLADSDMPTPSRKQRLSLLKSPAAFLSKNCIGYPDTMDDSSSNEETSPVGYGNSCKEQTKLKHFVQQSASGHSI